LDLHLQGNVLIILDLELLAWSNQMERL
jgi:hypothetical protein